MVTQIPYRSNTITGAFYFFPCAFLHCALFLKSGGKNIVSTFKREKGQNSVVSEPSGALDLKLKLGQMILILNYV